MSKFNTVATAPVPAMTENHCGWAAYEMDDKSKLMTQVLTSFFNEKKFYGDNSDEIRETIRKVIDSDPLFVSRLAMFARREFNMRSISHVLIGYLAHEVKGKPFVKETVKSCVLRGDDATEILAFYLSTFGKPIPNSLRKALRDVFCTFDSYTLAKYKGEGKETKMRDVLCLTHPSPKNSQQSETWKKLLEGKLEPAYTWETELSTKGNKKETWEALIDSGRLPYMAMLRNLRNIVNADVSNLDKVLAHISDPEVVRNSRQLPFRYMAAYNQLRAGRFFFRKAMEALETAADISVGNLQKIPGRTVIAIDVSGSMGCSISDRSDVSCSDIAMLLGVIANRICEDAIVYTFDTRIRKLYIPQRNGILYTANELSCHGGGTDMSLPFTEMIRDHVECDRVIILSDNECNCAGGYGWDVPPRIQQYADDYRKASGRNIWVHAVDLCGYGTQQFAGPKTNIIAGWSEKVFDFIRIAEEGEGTLMKRIREYNPREGK